MQRLMRYDSPAASSKGDAHGAFGSLGSRRAPSRLPDAEDGALSLPKHLWYWVALQVSADDCTAALQCSTWLLGAFEIEALWLHYCMANDFARDASGPSASWIYPFPPKAPLGHSIQWQRLLQLNMRSRGKPSVWIRIQDVDLRLPLSRDQSCTKALLQEMSQLLSEGDCRGQLPSTMPSGKRQERPGRALRLRHLQWGGRPGAVHHNGASLIGGRFLLEWPLPACGGWPLPPTRPPLSSSPKSAFHGMSFFGWLHGVRGLAGHYAAAPAASPRAEVEPPLMIRVVSLLLPHELWLCLPLDATVSALYRELAKGLRHESPMVAEVGRPVKYRLMDSEKPWTRAAVVKSLPLRELFWAQSETLRVELESSSSRQRRGTPGGDSRESSLTAHVWRELAFKEAPALSGDRCGARRCSPAADPWSRQVSEPPPRQSSDCVMTCPGAIARQVSDPILPQTALSRQLSLDSLPAGESEMQRQESELLGLPEESFVREVSEPPPLPGVPNRTWFPLRPPCPPVREASSGDGDFSSEGEPPEATSLSLAEVAPGGVLMDPPGSGPAGSISGRTSARADRAGGSWERVVPHYAPQLLPRTFLTRQFEFHPTLPEVMLLGDKKGSVNIFNLETGEVHQPVSVGSHPLLALVWLRHHPQRAICGSSQSGRISFLQYNPHAAKAEPALQRVNTLEEFAKLSSLSANCTDDFLLASGISCNLAVYDVQTGKALCQAYGVHEQFINISRFCHNSPHIFATASFDRTCKIWDLRQPLLHDRPMKTLNTSGRNVMCAFSPDDEHLLCSGMDTRLTQFEVPSWRQTPERFPLREPRLCERYRRSTYLATNRHLVTAATEESHMHLLTTAGEKLGVVNFRGVVRHWAERWARTAGDRALAAELRGPQVPRSAMQLEGRSFLSRVPSQLLASHRSGGEAPGHARAGDVGLCAVGHEEQSLVQGAVQLDDADAGGGFDQSNHEYVQSIRAHPLVKNRIGALLAFTEAEESFVSIVDVHPKELGC